MFAASLSRRVRWSLLAVVALAALLGSLLVVVSSPVPAQAVTTGSGGQFVSTVGRVLDTRNGTGGYSTPMSANVGRAVQVTGKAGVPSDASAVVLAATVVNPSGSGQLFGRADASTPGSSLMMVYGSGSSDTVSNVSTLAIGAGGKVTITAETSVDVVLDVQGYYTSTDNGVAAGGFVVGNGATIASTV
ncbi:MAG: hypothetical protein V4737_08615, partial [Curtobacterium sp.]